MRVGGLNDLPKITQLSSGKLKSRRQELELCTHIIAQLYNNSLFIVFHSNSFSFYLIKFLINRFSSMRKENWTTLGFMRISEYFYREKASVEELYLTKSRKINSAVIVAVVMMMMMMMKNKCQLFPMCLLIQL